MDFKINLFQHKND